MSSETYLDVELFHLVETLVTIEQLSHIKTQLDERFQGHVLSWYSLLLGFLVQMFREAVTTSDTSHGPKQNNFRVFALRNHLHRVDYQLHESDIYANSPKAISSFYSGKRTSHQAQTLLALANIFSSTTMNIT